MVQPDIFAAWLFTFAGRPDLTQKYTRMVPTHHPPPTTHHPPPTSLRARA
jgi:putative alpha-1,2-mannosidase